MIQRSLGIAFAGVSTLLVIGACSSSETPAQPTPDASTSGGGAGGGGGTGGRATGGSAVSTGGAPAVTPGPPVTCGSATCEGLVALVVALPACCSATTHCGLDATPAQMYAPTLPKGCIETHQPGAETATCPDRDVNIVTSFRFKGCCRPEGQCGLHADITGQVPGLDFGCVKPADFGVALEGGALPACTPTKTDGGGQAGAGGAPSDAGPG